ncbi:MAG: hypothetical protein IT210_01645 [Armatimonadetes bacterium]|nr:hypothetical protein [Armatimonadota bacterium]
MKVSIFGLPQGRLEDHGWKSAAEAVARQLHKRFGNRVEVEYTDLFTPAMSQHPEVLRLLEEQDLEPPVVLVDGEPLPGSGKIVTSAIIKALEAKGLRAG